MGGGKSPQWAVRDGKWKLIGNPRDTTLPQTEQVNGGKLKEKFFLADLGSDPGESTNLVDRHPEVVEKLLKLRDRLTDGFVQN